MRAALLVRAEKIGVVDIPDPVPGSTDVELRPLIVGLCGSDVSYFRKGANGAFVVQEPMVLGHEVVAEVVDQRGQSSPPAGTIVAVHPMWPSPRAGRAEVDPADRMDRPRFLGSASIVPPTQGGLAERLFAHPGQLHPLSPGLSPRIGVLAEPLSVVLHALGRISPIETRQRVLVSGAGSIGLLTIGALVSRGCVDVTAVDLRASALARATTLGARAVIDASNSDVAENSVELAIEASGSLTSLAQCLRAVRAGGVVLQIGMLPRDPRPMALDQFVAKELRLVGTHRFAGEMDDALDLLAVSPQLGSVITHEFDLADVADALRTAEAGEDAGKVTVNIGL